MPRPKSDSDRIENMPDPGKPSSPCPTVRAAVTTFTWASTERQKAARSMAGSSRNGKFPGISWPAEKGTSPADMSINELLLAYLTHAQQYYVKDGEETSEVDSIRQALRFMKDLYGTTPARNFGPLALKVVRRAMIDHKITRKCKHKTVVLAQGLSRGNINKQIARIKRLFSWAVENELVPPATYQALAEVAGLRKGRTEAREKPPVLAVPQTWIDVTLPFLPPMVADMVRVQLLCGARPGELVILRPCDIDMSGPIWEYRPTRHKTEHHERDRIISFGPQAQAILKPYFPLSTTGYLFSPLESERRRNEGRRKRPFDGEPWKVGSWIPGNHYDVASYRRAIRRACTRAGIPVWAPNQLRHAAGTNYRKAFGLETAQAILGHAELGTTQVYAEVDRELAREAARKMG